MSVESRPPRAPARGTRPPNRRALITAAATDLFRDRGYDQVAMSDIAELVGVGASALYRHFPGKQQLLVEVIRSSLASSGALLEAMDTDELREALPALASSALDQSSFPVLWQREARHLPDDQRTLLRDSVRDFGRRLAELVGGERPDLSPAARDFVAWTMLAVLMSSAFHRTRLARPAYDLLLADLAGRVLSAPVRADFSTGGTRAPRGVAPRTRREALLAEAVRLFAARGYVSVGIEDIAASLGIAGQSVYNHFPSKLDMLLTALARGGAHLRIQVTEALAMADDEADALGRLNRSYIRFAIRNPDLVGLLINDVGSLPDEHRQEILAAQRDHIDDWVHLVRQVHPELDAAHARITVHATIALANQVARTPHLRNVATIEDAVDALNRGVLRLPPQP